MVLLNPAASRGHSGQEIRADLRPKLAARMNNPSPSERVAKPSEGEYATPADLGSSARDHCLRESIDAIRARLKTEDKLLKDVTAEARAEGNKTYDALARFREKEETSGVIVDEHG
ncbi:MAG: hypothetical protein KOO63_04370 [Bacteroidales bacterium]|nr:hypothetical protein [Candidatus Latescibacterota bacterium]